jgi:hypothetical protein
MTALDVLMCWLPLAAVFLAVIWALLFGQRRS